jgi:hypothetical protein
MKPTHPTHPTCCSVSILNLRATGRETEKRVECVGSVGDLPSSWPNRASEGEKAPDEQQLELKQMEFGHA